MCVHWKLFLSEPFCVFNRIRQETVLSPFVFAVYLDGLLVELSKSGVGCHWGSSFAGAFSYADDMVLLAPCASALRTMLNICIPFAVSHKLEFNSMKTQLMFFHCPSVHPITVDIYLNNIKLYFGSHVKHLGHILSSNLDDTLDIQRAVKDLNCKANNLLCTSHLLDPLIKTFLLRSYC